MFEFSLRGIMTYMKFKKMVLTLLLALFASNANSTMIVSDVSAGDDKVCFDTMQTYMIKVQGESKPKEIIQIAEFFTIMNDLPEGFEMFCYENSELGKQFKSILGNVSGLILDQYNMYKFIINQKLEYQRNH